MSRAQQGSVERLDSLLLQSFLIIIVYDLI